MGETKNWWENHLSTCGTSYRGCDPECPKELMEKLILQLEDKVTDNDLWILRKTINYTLAHGRLSKVEEESMNKLYRILKEGK